MIDTLKAGAAGLLARVRGGSGASEPPAPADFQASEPGGASAPLIWLVVVLTGELAFLIAAAGFFGVESAKWFCEPSRLLAFSSVLGVLVPSLLAYRSFNKRQAATVAIAHVQAQATVAAAAAVVVAGQPT